MQIEMCKHYRTTGYPTFNPGCAKGLKASLKCHSKNEKCPEYGPSELTIEVWEVSKK